MPPFRMHSNVSSTSSNAPLSGALNGPTSVVLTIATLLAMSTSAVAALDSVGAGWEGFTGVGMGGTAWTSLPHGSARILAGGDFANPNFAAAAPYSYTHATGGGAWNDGTNGGQKGLGAGEDLVESLEGGDFACGDTVTYLMKIEIRATPTDSVNTAFVIQSFSADSTGQSGAGHVRLKGLDEYPENYKTNMITNPRINRGAVENGGGFGRDKYGPDLAMNDNGDSEVLNIASAYYNLKSPFIAEPFAAGKYLVR